MEDDRLERQNGFADLVHRFNVALHAPRRGDRGQLSIGIDSYKSRGTGVTCLVVNTTDIAG